MAILTILIHPIHKHGISFHFFVSSLVSLINVLWFPEYRMFPSSWLSLCAVLSHSVISDSLQPMDCSPPGFCIHGILQARILKWVAMPSSGGPSQPQGSNPGLLLCRQTLYHLSHQGSPRILEWVAYPF